MSNTQLNTPAPFRADSSGTYYLPLDKTKADSWGELYELIAAIRGYGFKAFGHSLSVAAEEPFAEQWNRIARRYTSKRQPLRGARMKRLVSQAAGAARKKEPA